MSSGPYERRLLPVCCRFKAKVRSRALETAHDPAPLRYVGVPPAFPLGRGSSRTEECHVEWRHPGSAVPVPPAEHAGGGPLAPGAVTLRASVAGDAEPQPPGDHRRGGQPNRQRQPVHVARLHQDCGGTPAAVMAAACQPAVRAQPASRIG
jgi:hypothetical protein